MQYSTVALRALAIEDVLTRPGHMHAEIGTKLAQLREFRLQYADAQGAADLESFPPPRRRAPEAVKESTTPTNRRQPADQGAVGHRAPVPAPAAGARKRPQMALPDQDAAWWVLAKLDSALVSTADGTTASWYQRDPKLFRSLGRRSLVAAPAAAPPVGRLAAEYRAAAPDFTSPERWRRNLRGVGQRARRRDSELQRAASRGSHGPPARARPAAPAAARPGGAPAAGGWAGDRAVAGRRSCLAAAAMLVLGLWGLARDSAMGNDEVATR